MEKAIKLSIVVPVYNEAENIALLDTEIKEVLKEMGKTDSSEILYINDGSKDDTLKVLKGLSGITIINLNRNYGQATALDAGFKNARGEIIVSLDGDGQNDPKDIPRLLEKLEVSDFDVVAGWRKERKDESYVRILTVIGRGLRRFLIHDMVHDTGCTLRAYKREAAQSLDIGGEMHRYILALLRWKGFKISEIVVNHRRRLGGKSKYGASKMFRGFIDLVYIWFINKYSQRPLHMFGYLSFASFFLSIASFWVTIYQKFEGLGVNRNGWFFLGIGLFLSGIMFFSFGIALDLLIRIQLTMSPYEKRYYIKKIIKT